MMDRETQQRVWQRVLGQEDRKDDLEKLLLLSRMQSQELKYLDRELYRTERLSLGILTGLYELSEGKSLPADIGEPPRGNPPERLRRCRQRCREMLMLCVRLENHPRYGAVFTDLTRQRRAMCAQLEQRAGKK